MEIYTVLSKYPVFSIKDVKALTGNEKTAYSRLEQLMKKGLVKKIRKNMYSAVNPATGQIFATRFQIACAITDTAYISHHSACEYHGLTNQVYYEVYVSSKTKFNHFEYDNIVYKYLASRMDEGIITAKNTSGVRVTDLERTVVDSIRDLNKIGGLEEILKCLENIHYMDESKLKYYLDIYDTQGLYQKTGYLLDRVRKDMQLSEAFFDLCKSKIGKSRRYLVDDRKDNTHYENEWKLMVPDELLGSRQQKEESID